MAKKDKRFVKTYSQGMTDVVEILVDRETWVSYLFRTNGYAGGMTPLLDRDGKPIVTSVLDFEEE